MNATISEKSGYGIVTLEGRLDVVTAPEVSALLDSTDFHDKTGIVFDIGGVDFIDSSGIGMIVERHHQLTGVGKRLVVADPTEQAQLLLKITNLDLLLDIAGSAEDAIGGADESREPPTSSERREPVQSCTFCRSDQGPFVYMEDGRHYCHPCAVESRWCASCRSVEGPMVYLENGRHYCERCAAESASTLRLRPAGRRRDDVSDLSNESAASA